MKIYIHRSKLMLGSITIDYNSKVAPTVCHVPVKAGKSLTSIPLLLFSKIIKEGRKVPQKL